MHKNRTGFGLFLACGFVVCQAVTTVGEIIPPDRRITWRAGVPGGIPNRTIIFCNVKNPPFNAKGDGVTDDSAAIRNAINACPSNQVVYLPTGNYLVNSQITISSKSYWTLRGDGPGKTIITGNPSSGTAIFYLGQGPWVPPATANLVSGYNKGSTNITLSTVSGIAPNVLLYLDQLNDGSFVESYGASDGNGRCTYLDRLQNGTRNLMQVVKVTAINANSVNFWPPLNLGFSPDLSPQATEMYPSVRQAGLENFTITTVPGSEINHHVFFEACDSSWIKNVESVKAPHWHFMVHSSLNCEIRDCYIHEGRNYGRNQGYGIEARVSTGLLIENNVLWYLFTGLIVTTCNGCVMGYNYVYQSYPTGVPYMQSGIFGCHGAHPYMNLWEGNFGNTFQTDFYWGSSSHQTLFRNYFTGTDVGMQYDLKAVSLDSHSLSNNVVGNVLGSPGLTWTYEDTTSGYWRNVIWRLGFPEGNNFYSNTIPPSVEKTALDTRVKDTLLRHGNYDYATRSIVWDPAIADRALPPSMYLTGKPAWFGDRPWPPFDPANPSAAAGTNLPAGYRFVFGTNPPQPTRLLRVVAVANGWSLSFIGTPGAMYQFQRAAALPGPWLTRATVSADENGYVAWVDTNAPATQAFYRVNY